MFCDLVQQLVKSSKIVEKSKNSKLNFSVLSVTRTTTFSKYVYTFELWFLLEKLESKILRFVFLQNPHKILRWILDILWELVCLGFFAKICTKLLKGSSYINYLVILINLPI
jgi:hypothetical protein